MEHYRMHEGKQVLSQGYFCPTCGMPCGMLGHLTRKCEPNPNLVAELRELNKG